MVKALFAGVAALLLLATPMDEARAQAGDGSIHAHPLNSGGVLRVSSVELTTRPPRGGDTFRLEENIWVFVTFNRAVEVTGSPQIGLTIGAQTRQASFDEHVSDRKVRFSYVVQASDLDTDGISIAANALNLNGGTITSPIDPTLRPLLSDTLRWLRK